MRNFLLGGDNFGGFRGDKIQKGTIFNFTVRKDSPDMSFKEISKKLAYEWSRLGQEEKQKYVERADLDKERYSQEFLEYQQTDKYKEFISQQATAKNEIEGIKLDHTVILSDRTLKKWALSSFAFQSF